MGGRSIEKLLIITSTIDRTVDYIISKYNKEIDFFRLNTDLINDYRIAITNDGWSIYHEGWKCVLHENDINGIYYRKPRFPNLNEFEKEYRSMINNDILSMINGIVDSFNGKVLTKPSILRKCENKIYQLMYAKKLGLSIPVSFIGNSNVELIKMQHYKSIIKPIYTGKIYKINTCEIYQTCIFDSFHEDVSFTPIYLQEYVNKSFEVRITIVKNSVFSVKIESKDLVDWRKAYETNKYSLIDVPHSIKNKLFQMMDDFNIDFGAFDFIVNEDGKWIFLEVNPNGQWQWLEKALDLEISNSIISYFKEER